MNKRILAAAAAAALMTALAGCMPVQNGTQTNTGDSAQTQEQTQNQQTQEENSTTANPFNRGQTGEQSQEQETVDLTVSVDGTRKTVKATVYTGSGYTIAVPEGWERSDREPQWNPVAYDDAELTIRFYSGKKAEDVLEPFQRSEDDYAFEKPRQSSLAQAGAVTELRGSETDDDGITNMVAYFIDTDAGCYGILLECPDEAAESYGGYLGAMANSFTLKTQTAK